MMAILVCNVSVPLDGDIEQLPAAAAKKLRVPREAIRTYAVVRRSIDARRDRPLRFNCQPEVNVLTLRSA